MWGVQQGLRLVLLVLLVQRLVLPALQARVIPAPPAHKFRDKRRLVHLDIKVLPVLQARPVSQVSRAHKVRLAL